MKYSMHQYSNSYAYFRQLVNWVSLAGWVKLGLPYIYSKCKC